MNRQDDDSEARRKCSRAMAENRARPHIAGAVAVLLVDVGETPTPAGDPSELAAMTLVASAVLNLDEAISK